MPLINQGLQLPKMADLPKVLIQPATVKPGNAHLHNLLSIKMLQLLLAIISARKKSERNVPKYYLSRPKEEENVLFLILSIQASPVEQRQQKTQGPVITVLKTQLPTGIFRLLTALSLYKYNSPGADIQTTIGFPQPKRCSPRYLSARYTKDISYSSLLTDAKSTENTVQNIFCHHLAANPTEVIQHRSQFQCYQFMTTITRKEFNAA